MSRGRSNGGRIVAVAAGSIGQEIGLEPGDVLVAINGYPLRDIIDYRYYGAEEELLLEVERAGQRYLLEIERDYDEELGLSFEEPLFDGLRQCNNRCPFCFVRQMPPGLRPTLYCRDDDYRYSFLLGNFCTLTNLLPDDWRRIEEQHLSPLYVSIHATDLEVRRKLLGNPHAPDILTQLRRLGEMGIAVHGQIVLVPEMNDGAVLQRSIEELAGLWPTVQTLALVPVGLTRYHRHDVRLLRPEEAEAILHLADEMRSALCRHMGVTWLYPSDELYLLAGQEVPPASFYDTDAQRENGVGLVRELEDDWAACLKSLKKQQNAGRIRILAPRRITLVCGTLIAPVLSRFVAEIEARTACKLKLVPVRNHFFGESVTVSGLLTAADVLDALAGQDLGECVLLPRVMFGSEGRRTLDDVTPAELAARLGVPIALVSKMSQVLAKLTGA